MQRSDSIAYFSLMIFSSSARKSRVAYNAFSFKLNICIIQILITAVNHFVASAIYQTKNEVSEIIGKNLPERTHVGRLNYHNE